MGVTFGTYHSKTNFHLDYLHKEIASPEPKTNIVSIPLTNGDLDLTERMTGGSPVFTDRNILLQFEMRSMRSAWLTDYANIMKALHGRVMDVTLDEDNGYRWHGRVTVGPIEDHGFTAGITINVDAYPYKWSKTAENTLNYSSVGTRTVSINVSADIAIPKFTVANNCEVTYRNQVYVATSQVSSPPGLVFLKGNSQSLKLVGSGSCKVEWFGGAL